MPIYVYRCERCKERFERLVPMSANSATALCPHCGAEDARKQLASFATLDKVSTTGSNASTCAPGGG
jgi:putative FmdB family regulatory protein